VVTTLLLSLLPPSCMVVPKSESSNTLFPFTLNPQSSIQESTNILNQQMNIEIDTLEVGQCLLVLTVPESL